MAGTPRLSQPFASQEALLDAAREMFARRRERREAEAAGSEDPSRIEAARAADRAGAPLRTVLARGLRPRTPSSPDSLALVRPTGQELRS